MKSSSLPLLSHVEEIRLIQEAQRTAPPDATPEEKEAVKAAAQAARNILVERNMGLVYRGARRYREQVKKLPGAEFEDLIQEGTLGLFQAVEKFDLSLGTRFGTFAFWRIRYAIQDCLRRAEPLPGSLEVQSGGSELDNLPDPISLEQDDAGWSGGLLENLSARQRDVLCWRFGLAGHDRLTIGQIAKRLGLSSSAVNAIVRNTLQQLRPSVDAPETPCRQAA